MPRGLILENTFTSIGILAAGLFPFLGPFLSVETVKKRLLRIRWETLERIREVTLPILFISGEQDTLIPPAHMETLRKAAGKAKIRRFVTIPEGTHNDTWMTGGQKYWQAQESFMEECAPSSEANT